MNFEIRKNRVLDDSSVEEKSLGGRPPLGENPLVSYAQEAGHPAMKALASEAVRRGLNLEGFARLLERRASTVKQYLRAGKRLPIDTVVHIARALGYPACVAHALMDKMDAAGEELAMQRLMLRFYERHALFWNALPTFEEVRKNLDLNATTKKRVLSRFLVADFGLEEKDSIEILEDELKNCDFDLSTHYASDAVNRQRQGYVLLLLMRDLLALTPAAWETVIKAANPFFMTYSNTWKEIIPKNADDTTTRLAYDREKNLVQQMKERCAQALDATLEGENE